MNRLDRWANTAGRRLARRTGRRSFLARVAGLVLGSATLPLLPVARAAAEASAAEDARVPAPAEGIEGPIGDPQACEYWRHCAIDGFLCSCCGGTADRCPPGSEMSPVTWIGTCRNPQDGKDYVISYNDCCGKTYCGRCFCNRNEGERPMYHWYRNNDVNWCVGTKTNVYHCSIAVVIGRATEPQPER